MAAEVARNAWGVVNHHQQQGVLELRWLPSTSEMTDDDFKATLELFAEQAERTGAPFLLVDSTDFGHQFGEGHGMAGSADHPRLQRRRHRRFAFHVPEGFPGAVEAGGQPITDGPATFPTAWFTHRQHALDWLRDD
jgi:hypothetical protein